MSDPLAPQTPSPAPVAPESGGGFFQNLIDVYFSPREAFTRIVRNPRFLLPLVGYVVLVLGFTGIWMQKMDAREFMKVQIEESGQADKIPAEQREAIIEQQAKWMPIFAWVMGPVGIAVTLLVIAGVLMFIYRFFYSSEVTFRQAFAIVTWIFFAVSPGLDPADAPRAPAERRLEHQPPGGRSRRTSASSSRSPPPPSRSGRFSAASTSSRCGWSSCSRSASLSPAGRRRGPRSGASPSRGS